MSLSIDYGCFFIFFYLLWFFMPLNVFTFFQFIPQLYSSSGKMLHHRRAARGEGRGLPCYFLKIEKSALILEKRVLTVSILGLNLPFKMQF